MVVFGQGGFILPKVLYTDKRGFIQAKVVVFGPK